MVGGIGPAAAEPAAHKKNTPHRSAQPPSSGGNGGPAAAVQPQPPPPVLPLPDPYKLNLLIRTSIIALNQANQTGNYSVLRDLAAPSFRETNTAARLGEIFADLRKRNLDLSPIFFFDPKLVRPPGFMGDGLLRLSGYFETRPEEVVFDLAFQNVGGAWRLFGIAVATRPAAAAAAPAPPETAAPPAPAPPAPPGPPPATAAAPVPATPAKAAPPAKLGASSRPAPATAKGAKGKDKSASAAHPSARKAASAASSPAPPATPTPPPGPPEGVAASIPEKTENTSAGGFWPF